MADISSRRNRSVSVAPRAGLVFFSPATAAKTSSRVVVISDVSDRGARLSGADLPEQETLVTLRADDVILSARIAWSVESVCGVEFQVPLDARQ